MHKKKKVIIRSLLITITITILSSLIILGSTNALFVNKTTQKTVNNYNTGLLSITAISKSGIISLDNTLPMSDEDGVSLDPYTFTIKNNGNVNYTFDIQLLTTGETTFNPDYIKIKVDNDAVTTLSALTNSKIRTGITLAAQDTMDISIRVWLASNTPNSQIGKTFNSQLVINGVASDTTSNYGVTAASYITNLYNNAAKTAVTNNNITYNYATSVSLMNDRLGGTTVDYNAGNIRYYGASPNNYVWLGEYYTSDYTINGTISSVYNYSNLQDCIDEKGENFCTENVIRHANNTNENKKLYRIVGVFDNMVKLISEDSISKYAWDTSESTINDGGGINEWSQADLMKLLNPGYSSDTTNNSLYWNKLNGSCYSGRNNYIISCDFRDIGLSISERNKIAEVTWNLGAVSNTMSASEVYASERSDEHVINPDDGVERQDTWTGKVGLIYASDYGYAADFNYCNRTINDYNYTDCNDNNWLKYMNYYFLITSPSTKSDRPFRVSVSGQVESYGLAAASTQIRPSFYLNSEVRIISGEGTRANPYVIE